MDKNLNTPQPDGVIVTAYVCTLAEFKVSRTLTEVVEALGGNYSKSSISRMISNNRKIGVYLDEAGQHRLSEFKWLTPE